MVSPIELLRVYRTAEAEEEYALHALICGYSLFKAY